MAAAPPSEGDTSVAIAHVAELASQIGSSSATDEATNRAIGKLAARTQSRVDAGDDDQGGAQGIVIPDSMFRWPGGVVAYEIDPTLPVPERVHGAIEHLQQRTAIRFVPRNASHLNYVRFRPGRGCSSRVGMVGGQQFITLSTGCPQGSVIHEIGHALGLWHEQSREDRDGHVHVVWDNIEDDALHNFNQHITDGDDVGIYDFRSIMHYPRDAFSKNGLDTIISLAGQPIGQRTGLSDGDVTAVEFMYGPRVPRRDGAPARANVGYSQPRPAGPGGPSAAQRNKR